MSLPLILGGVGVLAFGAYEYFTRKPLAAPIQPGTPPPPPAQMAAVAAGNNTASPNVAVTGRLQTGYQTAPPAQVVPATPAQQIDPVANAIDAKANWGITLFVWDADLNAVNQPIVVDAIQANQAEITLTCILIYFTPDKTRAIIQWVPTVDMAAAPDLGDLNNNLVNGQFYWAEVHKANS